MLRVVGSLSVYAFPETSFSLVRSKWMPGNVGGSQNSLGAEPRVLGERVCDAGRATGGEETSDG